MLRTRIGSPALWRVLTVSDDIRLYEHLIHFVLHHRQGVDEPASFHQLGHYAISAVVVIGISVQGAAQGFVAGCDYVSQLMNISVYGFDVPVGQRDWADAVYEA